MHAARKSRPDTDEERISIPGITSRVVARVDRRTSRSVTLTRELPLLRVGTAIEAQGGRRGTIEGVWISMDGDVPALCVEVAYDDDRASTGRPPAVRGDATIGYEVTPAKANESGKRPRRPRLDDTNHDATLAYEGRREETVPYEAERITRRPPAPVIIRRTLWDRFLDALDAMLDRARAIVRTTIRPRLPSL
jgi:hypothetical protein